MTRKNKIAIGALTVAVLACSSAAQAQYTGPTHQVALGTVAAVLKNPVDDQVVTLRGFLLRQVGNEKYIFSDNTGEIRVDIDTKHLAGLKLDEKTKVELRGEVEKDFLESPEIDVDAITAVK